MDAPDDGALWEDPATSSGRPGFRAPHLEHAHAGGTSTIDFVRRGFVLLAGPDGQAWCDAARTAGAELGLPVESHCMTDAPGFAELYGTGAEGAVLLRPDGFIAWRARTSSPDSAAELNAAFRGILALA